MTVIRQPLLDTLIKLFEAEPSNIRSVGASMSSAVRFSIKGRELLLKWSSGSAAPDGWPDMMSAEAYGLQLLAQAQAVRVPAVVAHGPAEGKRPPFLIMEWLVSPSTASRAAAGAQLGEELARQHRFSARGYGLDQHNYCGLTPQQNGWMDSWPAFYAERRLGFQLELAAGQGLLPAPRRRRLEQLVAQLDQWIVEPQQPALLHGDLWGGNWLVTDDGRPAILDPAVYFGHREAELAMCRLFGGFPDSFYAAYDAAWPPEPGRDERIQLYQLYHLLNHLNLFGESYGSDVDRILRHYVG